MNEIAQTPRDFNYIKPRKRRLSEYEAVSCYTQPDPNVFDRQGWYLLSAEGRAAWRPESTRLQHPHWFDFRDPSGLWQRYYVKLQAEQERSIERNVEDAGIAGILSEFHPVWLNEIIGIHYRVWSFFEYGLFRAFSRAQREALSDTLGNALCFEAVDRIRHAQSTVLYLMELEARVEGFKDHASKDHWLGDPVYQPLRRLVETLMATDDWAEIAFAVNLVIDPIATEVGVSRLIRHHGPAHGDPTTPMIILTTERDRRRNQAWTEELVRMTTAPDLPAAENNRMVIRSWIERWTPLASAAAIAFAPVYNRVPSRSRSIDEDLAVACGTQAKILDDLGIGRNGNG
ncbi:MAG: monooxygenase [Candidatus Binataceae bacterium]|jgi:methane monooxygenase component A beta chain/propane monooxygenase small subunit